MPTVFLTGVHTAPQGDEELRGLLHGVREMIESLVADMLESSVSCRHVGFIPQSSALCRSFNDVQYVKVQVPDLYVGIDRPHRDQALIDQMAEKLADAICLIFEKRFPNLLCVDCQVHPLPKGEQNDATRALRIGHSARVSDKLG